MLFFVTDACKTTASISDLFYVIFVLVFDRYRHSVKLRIPTGRPARRRGQGHGTRHRLGRPALL